jgi:general secretion pathway protein L
VSLLRIRGPLDEAPSRCQWALIAAGCEPVAGEGPLSQLPRRAERVQLLIPAAQVLITRVSLPHAAKRHAGSVLAYAIEDEIVGEPDAGQASWLGSAGDEDVVAVMDKKGLKRWLDALAATGIRAPEVHCEALLLPWVAGQWSVAWDGREGIVRNGKLEGAATDCGDRESPPLSLRLLLEEAQSRGERPASIALYVAAPSAAPDIEAWQRELGVALHLAGPWEWRAAAPQAGVSLARPRQRWRMAPGVLARLRPAAWIAGGALAMMAVGLVADWMVLAGDQKTLRQGMAARFRSVFPDAVAVADPALQMRRKVADARHAAGRPDGGDFLPMIEQVAAAAEGLPAGAVRALSYEGGRITLELSAVDDAGVRRVVARLLQAGLGVDAVGALSSTPARATSTTVVLTVHAP